MSGNKTMLFVESPGYSISVKNPKPERCDARQAEVFSYGFD